MKKKPEGWTRAGADHRRASHRDQQAEIRTKISDQQFDDLQEMADQLGLTIYAVARWLIIDGLSRHGRTPGAAPDCRVQSEGARDGADVGGAPRADLSVDQSGTE